MRSSVRLLVSCASGVDVSSVCVGAAGVLGRAGGLSGIPVGFSGMSVALSADAINVESAVLVSGVFSGVFSDESADLAATSPPNSGRLGGGEGTEAGVVRGEKTSLTSGWDSCSVISTK